MDITVGETYNLAGGSDDLVGGIIMPIVHLIPVRVLGFRLRANISLESFGVETFGVESIPANCVLVEFVEAKEEGFVPMFRMKIATFAANVYT
jgi:hypothetical protein